jgi:hypothetical protein
LYSAVAAASFCPIESRVAQRACSRGCA